ncbi:MAG: GFA family protein [Maricaulaceae bacterium]|jgi:hypothetical protein
MSSKVEVSGGCHCGAVRFRAKIAKGAEALACNCSFCTPHGFLHLIVPESDFEILSGEDKLTEYRAGTGVARHLFCSVCGVKSFYRPRSNPDGWSVNLRCLDEPDEVGAKVVDFDGRDNWDDAAGYIAHLSQG